MQFLKILTSTPVVVLAVIAVLGAGVSFAIHLRDPKDRLFVLSMCLMFAIVFVWSFVFRKRER